MKFKILCILLSVTSSLCTEFNTSYCVTNGDLGLIISDKTMGKDGNINSTTKYLQDVTLIKLTSSAWQLLSSNDTKSLHEPILDERWEKFKDNKETNFQEIFRTTTNKTLFFSVRMYNNYTYLRENVTMPQWYHLKLRHGTFYICNTTDSNMSCEEKLDTKNSSNSEFYTNSAAYSKSVWKLHEYYYIFSNTSNTTTNVYKGNSTNCSYVQNGWIKLHLAMCKNCTMSLKLQANDDTNRTDNFNGTGHWQTKIQNITNFTSCFDLSVTTKLHGTNEDKPFWAIGDKLYFSQNNSCTNTTRYTSITSSNNASIFTCEDSNNNKYNVTSELPKLQCFNTTLEKMPLKKSDLPDQSSFSFLYLLIIIPIVFITGGIAAIWFIRKNKVNRKNKLTNDENMELLNNGAFELSTLKHSENNWPPIKISQFDEYITDVFDTSKKYHQLKKQFSDLPSGFLKPAQEGKKEENIEKNRYNRIYPYDENRVKLEKSLGDNNHTTDYINASYIQGFNSSKEYILTQNPLKNTVVDFFRMIWQEQVEYIVMITSNSEDYFRYLPDLKKIEMHNDIEVFVDEFKMYEFYDYRSVIIRRYGQKREIKHLHFHSWSPQMLSSHVFLEFTNHLLKIPHETSPIVFHCLAGVGRSATTVLCDIALRSAAVAGSVNFFDITKKLRECRIDVVPNLSQYQLAHLIVFESLHYKDTSSAINSDFAASFSSLFEGNSIKKKWSTYLEHTDWLYEAIHPYILCADYPRRNRYVDDNLLPAQHSRVVLQYKQPDYIHAMFVNAYNQQKNFIVAQQPLSNTISDFWIMILQNHVTTVINLNEPDVTLRGNVQFIPSSENSIIKIQGNITIQFSTQEEHLNYEKLSLAIYSMEKYQRHVTVLNVKNWPKIKGIPESTDVVISIWEVTREQKTQNFPILVCCDDGISSSSLVVCFFYMADKMLQQNKCDVVGAVKAVRRSHTKFINFEQFVFLHHCALAFYKNCFKLHSESR